MLPPLRLLLLAAIAICACASQQRIEENQLLTSLNKLLDFLILDIDHVDADCLMGIVVAEAQLNLVLEEGMATAYTKEVESLRDKCNYIVNVVKPKIHIPSEEYKTFVSTLLVPEMWQIRKEFVDGQLTYYEPYALREDVATLRDFMFAGMPNETVSDICLNDLIKKSKSRCCRPRGMCQQIIFDLNTSNGYPLTHKLLYMQVGRALLCFKDFESLQTNITHLCSRILRDSRSIENLSTTLQQDLYVEQMVLCGMEGFPEFLQPSARQHLLDWQREYGCYGSNYKNTTHRRKRMNTQMLYSCSSHYSGLAAGGLALSFRYLLHSKTNYE